MEDNRDSYLVNALLDNYEEPLDISLISNNPFIPLIGNNFNTPTNQNNEKRHILPESTPNLPPNLNNKTPIESKSVQELEGFIDQKCKELALGSLKRDAEMKQQISQELEAHYNTSLVKSLKEQIDILQSEVYFLREELREKNNLFKILMKSKISDNECHNVDTNNQNDKIPESAPSELMHTTTNINKNNKKNSINKINNNNNYNHKNISKNYSEKINSDNINNSMTSNINSNSGNENNNKNNSNNNKGNCNNSNGSNSNSNNNDNSSSKENNINSSNINSKINTNNINNNSKENNINSNGGDNSNTNKQKQTRKTAFIIRDSMVKKIDGYLLTSSVNHKYIVKVRPFLSAKTIDMLDYIKPTKRDFNPDVYLLHVGTNDLSSSKSPEQISMDILNLANSLKLDNNTVIVSSIVPRDDENKKKADEVNIILEELCNANNVGMISHRNINPKRHLNRSRLHLNDAGVSLFVRNFRDFLNNFDRT